MYREIKYMNEKWQHKIEQDIKELAVSITKLATSLDSFIKYSQEIQEGKFDQIDKKIDDHEVRIRYNTKFVYQAMAGISLLSVLISFAMRFIK